MSAGSNSAGADWTCLGDPAASSPSAAGAAGNASYSLPVRSLFGAPIVNLAVRICLPADPNCATPTGEVRGLTSEGFLVAQVPMAFNGFFELQMDGHVPTVFHMRKPIVRDLVDGLPLEPIPTAGVTQLAGLLNVELVPEFGIVAVTVVDCQGARAPGAGLANTLGGRLFYFVNGLPNVTASATDIQGLGGFANVPPRLIEVSATVAADGRLIGSRSVLPRAGWLTIVQVRPAALPLD
jgi:hypothetical protein